MKVDAISATPATQNEGGCHQVPRLPHEMKVHVTKCHACHAKCRQWCVTKMVGHKVVCLRWCVTKLCAKDSVW